MMWTRSSVWLILALVCAAPAARAQRERVTERPSLELHWDLRARAGTGIHPAASLYSGTARVRAGFAPGWALNVYGSRKSGEALGQHMERGFLVEEATVEQSWGSQRAAAGVVRIPFGIYDYRETYASGLIDYPMPRVDHAYNGVDWGVPGATWSGGGAKLQAEAALFSGRAAGVWGTTSQAGGGALRLQTWVGDAILGASRWDGWQDAPDETSEVESEGGQPTMRHAPVHLNGMDLRYTRPHLLLRGEYLFGTLAGGALHGWYMDAYYHVPKYAKLTLAARLEALRPSSSLPTGRQLTLGLRYVSSPDWTLAVNWRTNNMNAAYPYSWTAYSGPQGTWLFQVYHKIGL